MASKQRRIIRNNKDKPNKANLKKKEAVIRKTTEFLRKPIVGEALLVADNTNGHSYPLGNLFTLE